MRNVVLYIAVSIDGYIADQTGGVSWLEGDGSSPEAEGTYLRFIENIDTVIMGYTTYHQIITELSPDNWVYPGKKSYVITHRKLHSANEEIIFTDEDLASLIQRLKQEPGKDIWICGGASIIHQLVELDLIDYYTLTVVPTILGSGTALFSAHSKEVKLQTIATQRYNGFIETTYKRREHV